MLLDLMMPEVDGFEMLRAVRQTAAWRDMPVVIVTSKDLEPRRAGMAARPHDRRLQKGAYSRAELVDGAAATWSRRRAARRPQRRPERPARMVATFWKQWHGEDTSGRGQRDEPRHAVAAPHPQGYEVVLAQDGATGVAKRRASDRISSSWT